MSNQTSNQTSDKMSDETFVYEKAVKRIEEILEKMGTGAIELDQSITLYEEADLLLRKCNQKLSNAENKIETLIKNRNQPPTLQEITPKAK